MKKQIAAFDPIGRILEPNEWYVLIDSRLDEIGRCRLVSYWRSETCGEKLDQLGNRCSGSFTDLYQYIKRLLKDNKVITIIPNNFGVDSSIVDRVKNDIDEINRQIKEMELILQTQN